VSTEVRDALDEAVRAASHLSDLDAAAVAAAQALADKIDAWDVIVDWAHEDAAETESRPRVPDNDNVSLATFLKYLDQLGLTPAARHVLEEKKAGGGGGKLQSLRQGEKARAARK
jgi:hypothetical protein